MRKLWRTKGKRMAALFAVVLLLTGILPCVDVGKVQAAESADITAGTESGVPEADILLVEQEEPDSGTVTVTGKIQIPGISAGEEAAVCEGAIVGVTYPFSGDGAEQSETKTETAVTDENGDYSIEISDWDIREGDSWIVTVTPADGDSVKYETYTGNCTVLAEQVATRVLAVEDIMLEKREYTVTYTLDAGGEVVLNNGGDVLTGSGSVTVLYTSPYEIRVSVAESEKFHLSAVTVNGEEQLTGEDTGKENDCDEKVIELENGIAEDIELTVKIVPDMYRISVSTSEGGTAELTDGAAEGSELTVEAGGSVSIKVMPEKGYQVMGIFLRDFSAGEDLAGETAAAYADCTDNMDGSYQYTLCDIQADWEFRVEFGVIPVETKSLSDAGLSIVCQAAAPDADIWTGIPDEENRICAPKVTVTATEEGKLVRAAESGEYAASAVWETEGDYNVEAVCLRDASPADFGTEKRIVLEPAGQQVLRITVDATAPDLMLSEQEQTIYKEGTATEAVLSGKAKDANLCWVVWSTEPFADRAAILASPNKITAVSGEAFTVTVPLAEDADTDSFYLYAADKAGNCSAAGIVTVYRDGNAPRILDVSLEPLSVHPYPFGNYGRTEIALNVRVTDVAQGADGTQYPASGVSRIEVYAGSGETAVYKADVRNEGSADGTDTVTVKIPIGTEEAFASSSIVWLAAVDKMGNVSKKYNFTEFAGLLDAGIENDHLMLEAQKPDVFVSLPEEGRYIRRQGTEEQAWYCMGPEIGYGAEEAESGSGLASGKVLCNGVVIEGHSRDYTKTAEGIPIAGSSEIVRKTEETLASAELTAMKDGENAITIIFSDLAGNESIETRKIYLDRHTPQITGFSIQRQSGAADSLLNLLGFGNFTNGKVLITVTADDTKGADGREVPSAGMKEITLYLDGEAFASKPAADGTAVFEVPVEEILAGEERVYLDKAVTASVSDNVGNASEACDMTTGNSNLGSSRLMIETIRPTVAVTLSAQGYLGADNTVYNNADTGFDVTVSDRQSGLRHIRIDINGTVVTDDTCSVTEAASEKIYAVSTQGIASDAEGLYIMTVCAVDQAGNEITRVQHVYKDETAPEIQRYIMEAAGTVEADGASLSYSVTDYGYYFHEDTRVTIYAADGTRRGDSGVREINYYTVDANGVRSETQTLLSNAEGAVSFVIPAEFKGQIYACACDNLGNTTGRYVTPGALVVETPEQHAREEHIVLARADAPHMDETGNDLYAGDVRLDVTVRDTFSGIRSVEWRVEAPYDTGKNESGRIEIDNAGAFTEDSSTADWTRTGTERNLVTELRRSFTVSNNSNDIVVHVEMTDRAGNISEEEILFSIDKTEPVIEIVFDNETPDAEYAQMYKESRTATVTVTERNFNEAEFAANITGTGGTVPAISGWQTAENSTNPDATVSTATITFSEDGDYTLEISGHDRAGNPAEPVNEEEFTIDKTLPVITVTYDNENAQNGNYFAAERTATVRIEEHNFSPERVEITGTATDDGAGIAFPAASSFQTSGDVHTATIVCGADGLYRFDVAYTDMAGNEAETYVGEEYYVDMTEPEIEISGVENLSANNGDVQPQIALSDTNYDANGVSIQLIGANRGTVAPDGAYRAQGNGQVFTFQNFPREREYDDIYTIDVSLTDMAGNESTDTITFSVNRYGSVYVFDDSLKKIAGTYIQEEIDVRLTEINVDGLAHERTRVVVDTNGTPRNLEEGTDYTVRESGGGGSWYQYDYTIDKSLFAGDGRYIVTLYSEDAAGNVNENIDESKEAEISFGVDKTAPVVIPIDIESDAQYAVDTKRATVTVNDNLILERVEIYVDGKPCTYTTEGESYIFDVQGADARQDVTILAVDAAGNRTNYIVSGILVTTNAFIRWYNNKPLFAGTLAGVAALGGGTAGVGIALRSGRVKIRRKKK